MGTQLEFHTKEHQDLLTKVPSGVKKAKAVGASL